MKIHKRLLAGALVMLTGITMCGSPAQADPSDSEPVEKVLAKSSNGNPLFGFGPDEIAVNGQNGFIYGGDPSIMVDGDTVYAYVGQDVSTGEYYTMPRWLCYSTKDLKEWKYESTIMSMQDVSWRNDDVSAWASQVAKVGDKYYFFYCAEGNGSVSARRFPTLRQVRLQISDIPLSEILTRRTARIRGKISTPLCGWKATMYM